MQSRLPSRPSRGLWVALLVVLLFVGGLIAVFAVSTDDDDEAAPATSGVTRTPTTSAQTTTARTATTPTTTTPTTTAQTTTAQTTTARTTTARTTTAESRLVPPEPKAVQVPTVLNIGFVDAARFIEERGLIADSAAVPSPALRGAVIEQLPPGGTRLARGRAVVLKISLGAGERRPAEIPKVTGAGERSARNRLHRAGFTVRTVGKKAPKRENLGDVLLQRPAAGSFAPVLNRITIYVGR